MFYFYFYFTKSRKAPPVLWAQRKAVIFVTIDLKDVTEEKVEILPEMIKFSGKSNDTLYAIDIPLHEEIDNENSVVKTT
eukprot:Awhi_evm1s5112